jgi:hypothetical protein
VPELFVNLESVAKSKIDNSALLNKNFLNDEIISSLSWEKIIRIFRSGQIKKLVNFYSFATCSIDIDKIEDSGLGLIDKSLNKTLPIHSGEKIASSLSVSLIGKNDNKITNDYALEFKQIFENQNPFKAPKILPSFESIKTPKFFYSVDTFFIQTNGSSVWKIDGSYPEEHVLDVGDIIFIPKKLVHSAEYLSPGSILSLSFAD